MVDRNSKLIWFYEIEEVLQIFLQLHGKKILTKKAREIHMLLKREQVVI